MCPSERGDVTVGRREIIGYIRVSQLANYALCHRSTHASAIGEDEHPLSEVNAEVLPRHVVLPRRLGQVEIVNL